MNKLENGLIHEFVEFIPGKIQEGKLYISIPYATATHICCCGCGNEVVTPLSPTDWKLIFDGKSVSLDPSIGNWSFDCQSHYWIRSNRVVWAEQWSKEKINSGKRQDRLNKQAYFTPDDTVVNENNRGIYNKKIQVQNDNTPSILSKLRHSILKIFR